MTSEKMDMGAVEIRNARQDDAEALLTIYAPYVTRTAVSFEQEVPSVAEFAAILLSKHSKYDKPPPRT